MNTPTQWVPKYSVGHLLLDQQHQKLFGAYEELAGYKVEPSHVGKQGLHEKLNDLVHLVMEHFTAEEHLMEQCGFPHLAEHRELHTKHLEDITGILVDALTGRLSLQDMAKRLVEWNVGHIAEDMKYADYLKAV